MCACNVSTSLFINKWHTVGTHVIVNDIIGDHMTSSYQINARTELAVRYNDISPLENHHCAIAFEILEKVWQ